MENQSISRWFQATRKSPESIVNWPRNSLISAIRHFEEQRRRTTIYFTWVKGEEIVPERVFEARKNIVYRMFSESMLLLFILP